MNIQAIGTAKTCVAALHAPRDQVIYGLDADTKFNQIHHCGNYNPTRGVSPKGMRQVSYNLVMRID